MDRVVIVGEEERACGLPELNIHYVGLLGAEV